MESREVLQLVLTQVWQVAVIAYLDHNHFHLLSDSDKVDGS